MPTYAAFLRGISPLNAKMSELRKCFEAAGFSNVKTVLGSGNAVFESRSRPRATLERQLEAAMEQDDARILCVKGSEIYSAYVPSAKGPVFMHLIEKTFGKDLTTRTWDTIRKVVKAGGR